MTMEEASDPVSAEPTGRTNARPQADGLLCEAQWVRLPPADVVLRSGDDLGDDSSADSAAPLPDGKSLPGVHGNGL